MVVGIDDDAARAVADDNDDNDDDDDEKESQQHLFRRTFSNDFCVCLSWRYVCRAFFCFVVFPKSFRACVNKFSPPPSERGVKKQTY